MTKNLVFGGCFCAETFLSAMSGEGTGFVFARALGV